MTIQELVNLLKEFDVTKAWVSGQDIEYYTGNILSKEIEEDVRLSLVVEFGNKVKGDINLIKKAYSSKQRIYEDFLDETKEAVLSFNITNLMMNSAVKHTEENKVRII